DVGILRDLVDGFVLVVRANRTPRETLSDTLGVLGRQRTLGLVFNDDPPPPRKPRRYARGAGPPAHARARLQRRRPHRPGQRTEGERLATLRASPPPRDAGLTPPARNTHPAPGR